MNGRSERGAMGCVGFDEVCDRVLLCLCVWCAVRSSVI